jgi:hypothetical protein
MITEEHEIQLRKNQPDQYHLSFSLKFLAQNVQNHYPELWKGQTITRAFLPARLPTNVSRHGSNQGHDNIQLIPIQRIVKGKNIFI